GVLHCFSGGQEVLERALGTNMFVSFAGNVTYRNATEVRQAAEGAPLERLLIETDSPFLAPQQWRGKRNEPAHVRAVADEIAQLRGMQPEQIAGISAENASRLFNW